MAQIEFRQQPSVEEKKKSTKEHLTTPVHPAGQIGRVTRVIPGIDQQLGHKPVKPKTNLAR